jgi:2-methylcitrate dehydratase PrpD
LNDLTVNGGTARNAESASTLTQYVARFVAGTRYEDIPEDVRELAKKSILDGLGVSVSGSIAEPVRILLDYVRECGSGTCTTIGSDARLPARFAALVNGTAMHADDYDDTLQAMTGRYQGVHVTAPVLSAALAIAEQRGASGRDLLTAYAVGVEIASRTFDATNINHSLKGFHATATCGMLGACAAASHLMRFDAEHVAMALGLAATQAGGLLENIGSMAKPFHAGRSAEGGVVSNELVARGFTASTEILESPVGFFAAQGGPHEEANIRGLLGNPWTFVERGVSLKPFPSCALTHPALTHVRDLVQKEELKAADVARIRVRTSQNVIDTLRNHGPTDPLQAKFSLEFGLAAILHEGKCGLSEFNRDLVARSDVRGTMALVDYSVFTETEARAKGYLLNTTFLEIDLKTGRTLSARVDWGKGSKTNPMTMDEIADKYRDCAQYAGWPGDKTEGAIALVRRLQDVGRATELTACLAW